MSKPVILTGLRANSEFHIGNFLGGILPVIDMQKRHAGEYQINMFVPDLHSFTTPIDHAKLYQQTLDNLTVFIAAGLDITNPDTLIYRQSFIPAHSELMWILSTFTGFGQASRMTEFKDKSQKLSHDSVSVGLFNYPILMAADILLYNAKYVPVGDDQKQHLELTRDLAIKLNNKFNDELLTVPEPWEKQLEFMHLTSGARIRSLRNPEKKMSKSIDDPSGTIMLSDNPTDAAKKVMRAETDSLGKIAYDFDAQPGISNLLQMLSLLSGRSQSDVNAEWVNNERYGDLKQTVADAVKSFLEDIQQKIAEIDQTSLLAALARDEALANERANATLARIQKAIGLRQ